VDPPAPQGTIIRIGFVGFQSAADAKPMARNILSRIVRPISLHIFFMMNLPFLQWNCRRNFYSILKSQQAVKESDSEESAGKM
jgi:hypothetical protein